MRSVYLSKYSIQELCRMHISVLRYFSTVTVADVPCMLDLAAIHRHHPQGEASLPAPKPKMSQAPSCRDAQMESVHKCWSHARAHEFCIFMSPKARPSHLPRPLLPVFWALPPLRRLRPPACGSLQMGGPCMMAIGDRQTSALLSWGWSRRCPHFHHPVPPCTPERGLAWCATGQLERRAPSRRDRPNPPWLQRELEQARPNR